MNSNNPESIASFNQILNNISQIDFAKYSYQSPRSFNRHFREKDREQYLKPLNKYNRHFREKNLEQFIKKS